MRSSIPWSFLHSLAGRGRRALCLACFLVVAGPGAAAAQNAHWWTNQYGNRARLLGGAVIGSASDLSAVYYNPGALALVEQPEALLTGYVFDLESLAIKGLFAPENKISSTRLGAVAGLIAGEIRLKFLGRTRLAYSFLTRHLFEYRLGGSAQVLGEEVGLPEITELAGSVRLEERLSEYWGGLTWALPVHERVGVGLTLFGGNRNQRGRFSSDLVAVAGQQAGLAVNLRDYSYDHWRLLLKLGVRVTLTDSWTGGLTVTTPSLRLFGGGSVAYNSTAVAGGLSQAAVSFQEDIPSSYRNPLSIGAGAAYTGERWTLHLAAEWFEGLDLIVLDAEPFEAQTTGEIIDPNVNHRLDPILNVGVGASRQWNEWLSGYANFHTDFGGAESGRNSQTTTALWDLYSFGAGAIFAVDRSEFTLGVVYSLGSNETIEGLSFVPGLPAESGTASLDYSRWTFILGFNLAFGSGGEE